MLLFITVHLINGSRVEIVSANSFQSLLSLPASCRQACYPSAKKVSIILHTWHLLLLFFHFPSDRLPGWILKMTGKKRPANESFQEGNTSVRLSLWDEIISNATVQTVKWTLYSYVLRQYTEDRQVHRCIHSLLADAIFFFKTINSLSDFWACSCPFCFFSRVIWNSEMHLKGPSNSMSLITLSH